MCRIIWKFWKMKHKKERVYEQRIFACHQSGNGRERHLAAGFCLYQRRRLCRPSLLWSGLITRLLESRGYSVGIISQPDWRKKESISVFGEPRLAFLVSAGNMDSMVNHYTVAKKHRRQDSYSPGGQMGLRPDRAVTVYGNLIRQTYKDTPVILGGIEASLRRLAHYDYWSDSMKRSVLMDSGADLISYGDRKSVV